MSTEQSSEVIFHPHKWLINFCNHRKPGFQIKEDLVNIETAWQAAETHLGLTDKELTQAIADEFGLGIARYPNETNERLMNMVPRRVAEQYHIFPLAIENERIVVATSHPVDKEMLSVLGFLMNRHIETCIAHPAQIALWTDKDYPEDSDDKENVVVTKSGQEGSASQASLESADSAIVTIVSDMLFEAFSLNASDIHIEPYKEGGIIRYRIDGVLRVVTELPLPIYIPVVQRIKAISRLNLAKKMVPQDGNASLEIKGQPVDLRVSTTPVIGGEKVVIRLLIKSAVSSLDKIGLPEKELIVFQNLLKNSSGVFVITGPTGSGKTTTLYAALKELNKFETCLVTVEDPVEYEIDGIAQIHVNPAQSLTFNTALRSILRQDPDIILVGEVRDEETAETTFRAAMTGHFVMTTLHTNDAITTIPRLIGLGVPETIIADSLRGVASQRLVRKLCAECSTEDQESDADVRTNIKTRYPEAAIKRPVGCSRCADTGYKGRIPLFEIIKIDHELADAIRRKKGTKELREISAQAGNRSIEDVAIETIANGITSIEEVQRVLGNCLV